MMKAIIRLIHFPGYYLFLTQWVSVSSKEGLHFQLALNYSSTISTGSTNPNVGGILYGKGWNLNLPMITVKTEDYHKYSYEDYKRLSQSGSNYDPSLNANTPVYNRVPSDQGTIDDECEEAQLEGKLFWFSPVVSFARDRKQDFGL